MSGEVSPLEVEHYHQAARMVAAGGTARLIGTAAAAGLGLATTVLSVRLLGPKSYGILAFLIASLDLLSVFTRLGLGGATARELAARARTSESELIKIAQLLWSLMVFLSTLGTSVVVLVVVKRGSSLPITTKISLMVGLCALLFAMNSAAFAFSMARGLGRMALMEVPNFALVFFQFLLFLGLWLFAAPSFYIIGIGLTLVALAAILVATITIRVTIGGQFSIFRFARSGLIETAKLALPYAVAGIAVQVIAQFDVFLLGLFKDSEQVGHYAPTLRVVDGLLLLVPTMLTAGFLPAATRLFASGGRRPASDLFIDVSKTAYIAAFPALLAMIVFPSTYLRLLYGPAFNSINGVVRLLCLGYAVNLAFGLNSATLVATGDRGRLVRAYLVGLATMLLVSFGFIPLGGAWGAALATTASYISLNVAVGLSLYQSTGIHPFRQDMVVTIATSAVFCIVLRLFAGHVIHGVISASLMVAGTWGLWVGVLAIIGAIRAQDFRWLVPGLRK